MEPCFWFFILMIAVVVVLKLTTSIESKQELNLGNYFKPKIHFLFERCSRCGKRLKHYHWFWGRGDYMACDVDYSGNTEWYCEKCDEELSQDVLYKIPANNEEE